MMRPGNVTHTRGLLVLAVAACLFGGCQGGPVKTDLDPNEKHILKIASLLTDFRGAHKGRAPRDAQELKNWAKDTLKKDKLAARGIENLDDAFVSPRDKQPYVLVKPEAAQRGPGGRPPMLWVYEKTGVDGKRMGVNMGGAFEMDEERFKKLVSTGR